MRGFTSLVVLLTLAGASASQAAILEIPVELPTQEQPAQIVEAPFEVGLPPASIVRISLRLEGSQQDQFYVCGGVPYWNRTAPARIEARIGDELQSESYVGVTVDFPEIGESFTSRPFTVETVLWNRDLDDAEFLVDGRARVGFVSLARSLYYLDAYPCSLTSLFGEITSSTLVVVSGSSVPVEAGSWGSIKRLYD